GRDSCVTISHACCASPCRIKGSFRNPRPRNPYRQAVPAFRRRDDAFNSFWTIEFEEGWSLFATHPVNRSDLPFRLLSGIVDSDRFYDGGINFPAVWTDPGFCGVLRRGTPVAQCFPAPRSSPELVFATFDAARQAAYGNTVAEVLTKPGVYRKRFRVKRARSTAE